MCARQFLSVGVSLIIGALLAGACTTSVAIDSDEQVDQTADQTAAVAPAPTVVPERSSEQQSVTERKVPSSIRDVDFKNGFIYESLLDFGPGTTTVTDGSYENGEFGDEDFYWFGASDIEFGDLDGDGIEEALLRTTWNGGGTGYFDSVRVFRLVDGQVQSAGVVAFGDRADGGVHDVRIVDGTARVWAFAGGEGACCPTQIAETTLVLGEYILVHVGQSAPRAWVALDDPRTAQELNFLPGTSSAVLSMYANATKGSVTFEASAGQQLSVAPTNGPEPTVVTVWDLTTGEALVDTSTTLPTSGLYEIEVEFGEERDQATMWELVIDGGEPEPSVQWSADVDQVLLDDEPFVYSSVTWPVFRSPQPGVDAANRALGEYATGLDDWWVSDVTEYEDPQDDSSYEVTFEVTLTTADLVSVRFDYFDYVCCRPYPNYGSRAVVLDLAAGRLIPVEEILDLSRLGDINTLWFAELERQELLPPESVVEGEDVVRFDSLTLTRDGIEFGTDRNSLGGGLPGTRTLLTYVQLGDLVQSDLMARAQ